MAERRHRRCLAGLALVALLAVAALVAAPDAAARTSGADSNPESEAPAFQTPIPSELPETPSDYAVGPREAIRTADTDPLVAETRRRRGPLSASVDAESGRTWEVGYFAGTDKLVLVVVDGSSGEISESWTGDQVAWPMARGREGQFGHVLNAPYVWIPMAALFFAVLFDWRRPGRIAHLDLLALLSFGISQVFFNAAEIGVSVPLYYPPLLYLLARMLWIGVRGAGAGSALAPRVGTRALIGLCLALAIFRIGINIADSGVIDVGYAGVVGADRIADAEGIYGEEAFPENNPTGDTYGPANYFAYVPFEQILPWSGDWDGLPAARAAAIFFDLLCVAGLMVLGRRLAGKRLGWVLAFAWLAYPYTAFVLQSNSNDSLLAAVLIWSLVGFGQPVARGALLAVAAATKFAPLVLAPLYLAGRRGLAAWRPRWPLLRPALLYGGSFAAAAVLMMAHPAIDPGLATFYDRTIGSQAARESPFSIWGQADLEALHTAVKLGVVALAIGVALMPRRRSFTQVAALGAALMIAVELIAEHWFYLYIVWFLPMLLIAIATGREGPPDPEDPPPPGSGEALPLGAGGGHRLAER